MIYICTCGFSIDLPYTGIITCHCGKDMFEGTKKFDRSAFIKNKEICQKCVNYISFSGSCSDKGCKFLSKPCETEKVWLYKIETPNDCPNKIEIASNKSV